METAVRFGTGCERDARKKMLSSFPVCTIFSQQFENFKLLVS
jgi:hypothetical protein